MGMMSTHYIVAIDGGGSKTDAVAIDLDGTVLARAQTTGTSPHMIGLEASVDIMNTLVDSLGVGQTPVHTGIYLSGLDLQQEIHEFRAAVGVHAWAGAGLDVRNDLFALLRAGTSSANAAAVVCGTGINAIGIRADGQTVRFPALGRISGDWGGALGLGEEALWHAARDEDKRGPHTALTAGITRSLGFSSIGAISEALHLGALDSNALGVLSPLVFEQSTAGDIVAGSLVDRLAEEIALLASSCLSRLGLLAESHPIVLGGGVIRGRDPRLLSQIATRLTELAPLATTVIVDSPPILGAGMLALEAAGASADAVDRARDVLA